MKRALQAVFLVVFAAQALVVGQSGEVTRVLSEIRAALGGNDKLAAVKSIAVEGQTTRPASDGSSTAQDFEMAFELPGGAVKFVKKDVVMNLGGATISRRSGFNGADLIDEMDTPPSMGGNIRMMRSGAGPSGGGPVTPEQAAEQKTRQLTANHREFARIALGMLGTTTTAYPMEFTYAGKADSTTGKADVLDLKAADGFSAKLYVDGKTHLPLMLTWMDKEPIQVTMNAGSGAAGSGSIAIGNGATVRTFSNGSAGAGASASTPQDAAKLQEEMAARLRDAEANRKTVEFRIFYADYKAVDGIRLPTRIQRMVDGLPTEEMSLDKIKVNAKIDQALFGTGK